MSNEDNEKTPVDALKDFGALNTAQVVVGYIVGAGTSKIVKDIIAHNIDAPEGRRDKVMIYAGAAMIGMMAKDATKAYSRTKVVEWHKSYKRIERRIQETRAKREDNSDLSATEPQPPTE